MSINARSLIPRLEEIKNIIQELKLDIICVQETWLTPKSKPFRIQQFVWIGTDPTHKKARGCGIFISERLKYKDPVISNESVSIEYVGITIKIKNRQSVKVWSIYAHPYAKKRDFRNQIFLESKNSILCGDFNAHHVEWSLGEPNTKGKRLFSLIKRHGFKIHQDKKDATWASTNSKGSPDLILVSGSLSSKVKRIDCGPDIGSDHLPLILRMELNLPLKKQVEKTKYLYENMNVIQYQIQLNQRLNEWIHSFEPEEINKQYDQWVRIVIDTFEEHCRKVKTGNLPPNPWWSEGVKKEVILRRKLRRKAQKKRDSYWHTKYVEQNKITKKAILQAKALFWSNLLKNMKQNDAYKIVKKMTKVNSFPERIKGGNGAILIDPQDIANEIGKFLHSTCENTPSKKIFENDFDLDCKIDHVVLENKILKMNEKKAAGSDGIYPFMIKRAGPAIIPSLITMFNTILKMGKSPDKWYESIVIPIPKKRSNILKVSEFRPISLTQCTLKIFEKCILEDLSSRIEDMNFLPEFQFGFRKNKSTIDCLVRLQQEIHSAFQGKLYFAAAFVDIAKAYDNVNIDILVKEIQCLDINKKVREWIIHHLKNTRYFKVRVNGYLSKKYTQVKGVQQGSSLSPLLFNLYVRSIPCKKGAKMLQFA
ncbi:putative RNA-directed DNA polymerase from transposon X-element, partial [Nosema granulosis]